MNKLVSAAQMRTLENDAFDRGVSGEILMEEAAYAAASEINRDFPKTKTITAVCGKGHGFQSEDMPCCGYGKNGFRTDESRACKKLRN